MDLKPLIPPSPKPTLSTYLTWISVVLIAASIVFGLAALLTSCGDGRETTPVDSEPTSCACQADSCSCPAEACGCSAEACACPITPPPEIVPITTSDFYAPRHGLAYWIADGVVHLEGAVVALKSAAGPGGPIAFTLPEGARPLEPRSFFSLCVEANTRKSSNTVVFADGTVTIGEIVESGDIFFVDGISFRAEQ